MSRGGTIDHTIQRADVAELLFRPIRNERSDQIREQLQTIFPMMRWYEEGLFTILTDSPVTAVKDYRRTIRELATEWYLTFFPVLRDRQPHVQHYVVIFDDWNAYIEYAATDGVPGWLAVGYFHPEDEVLYCFNMLGERFSELLYEVYLGDLRKARDQITEHFKGSQYELTVEGQLSEFLQKFERAHAMVRQSFGQISIDVLRHELTHALFHNWRVQGITLSQMAAQGKEEAQQKRKYLQATDPHEKRRLLDALLTREGKSEVPEMRAANSWLVEGLAGYMEPSPIGNVNQERLAEIQDARGAQQILPLEFLNAFRMGSFMGMATQSALYAYAQSWALCHFLLHRHPEAFFAYLDRLAREQPKEGDDTLSWLIAAVGTEQRVLEAEFLMYLEQFPKEDPLWLKQWQEFIDLNRELQTLASRLWGP